MKEHFFVNIMMGMQVGAIGAYVASKNYGLAAYWFGCLLINFVVTYVLAK